MKKSFLILISGVFLAMTGQAQITDFREKAMFGLKAGFNNSNVYDEEGDEFVASSKFGFAGGVFAALPLGKYIGVQPEILLSQKGFEGKGRLLGTTYDFTRTTTFIDVPLLLAFKPSGFLTVVAGPQYSYLVRQKDVFTNGTTTIDQEKEFENEDVRKNILCFTLGGDVNLQHIVLGARAGWDIQNNHSDGTSTTPRYKNVWYQATIGFRFFD